MRRELLRAKLHRATVTRCDPAYEGSLTLDRDLLDACEAWPYEAVEVYDITNGQRFRTYVIAGTRGSGEVGVNGAAAQLVAPGDLVICTFFRSVEEADGPPPPPVVALVDARNHVRELRRDPGTE